MFCSNCGNILIDEANFCPNCGNKRIFVVSMEHQELSFSLPNNQFLKMIRCPKGIFTMGSPESELGHYCCECLHKVLITKEFFLGRFTVTQSQYKAVMGDNPSHFREEENLPVEQVSWDDAIKYCQSLNELLKEKIPDGYQFRLPTEAQWEYACRANTETSLNIGQNITSKDDACANMDKAAWYKENSKGSTHISGLKQPNSWGIYDMHGNVDEWCLDIYQTELGTDTKTDPQGASQGKWRVCRGGNFMCHAQDCRSAYRINNSPDSRFYTTGFRVALVSID